MLELRIQTFFQQDQDPDFSKILNPKPDTGTDQTKFVKSPPPPKKKIYIHFSS